MPPRSVVQDLHNRLVQLPSLRPGGDLCRAATERECRRARLVHDTEVFLHSYGTKALAHGNRGAFERLHKELDAVEARAEYRGSPQREYRGAGRIDELRREVRQLIVLPGTHEAVDKQVLLTRIEELEARAKQGQKASLLEGLGTVQLVVSKWEATVAQGEELPPRLQVVSELQDLEAIDTQPAHEEHDLRKSLIGRLRKLLFKYEAPRDTLESSSNLAWRITRANEQMAMWRSEYEKGWDLPKEKELARMQRTLAETDCAGDADAQASVDGLLRKAAWFVDRIAYKKASPHLYRKVCRTTVGHPAFE